MILAFSPFVVPGLTRRMTVPESRFASEATVRALTWAA